MEMTNIRITTFPPFEISAVLEELRRPLCDLGSSFKTLTCPPYIELRPGLAVPGGDVAAFLVEFQHYARNFEQIPLHVHTPAYGTHREGNVDRCIIYYLVEKSSALVRLHENLQRYTRYNTQPAGEFEPHLALVYDDLSPTQFELVCTYLKNSLDQYDRDFTWICDNITLCLEAGQQYWPYYRYELAGFEQEPLSSACVVE